MSKDTITYVPLINQTINTLSTKKITESVKQRAIKFYHFLGEFLPELDQETKLKYREYEKFLREKGILKW